MSTFDWGALAGGVLSTGGTIFGASKQAEIARKEAQASAQNNATALELAKINQQTELLKLQGNQSPESGSSNTALYVTLGAGGVLILGLTIFMVTRK